MEDPSSKNADIYINRTSRNTNEKNSLLEENEAQVFGFKKQKQPSPKTAFKKTWPSWHFWEESCKHFANMKKVSLEDIASWWLAVLRGDKQGKVVSGVKQHHKAASISIKLNIIPVLAKVVGL